MVTSMTDSTFKSHGYVIDVERLYRAMYDLRVAEGDEIVFNGGLVEVNGKPMRAMKRLLNDLFGVPATENYHYTGDRVRSATRDYLEELGWATNEPRGTPRYVLHRNLSARTFLLTWNPKRGFPWNEREEVVRRTSTGVAVPDRWSVGARTSGFSVGDTVYLLRLGDDPRGVVASGTITDPEVRREPHWNGQLGKMANYVDLNWQSAVDDSEILSIRVLEEELPDVHWHPEGGGVLLKQRDAIRLATLWQERPSHGNTDPTDRRQAREAGYIADSAVRTAIEKHAERMCADHYEALGYNVDFVGAFRPYDMHLVHRTTGEERHVEVKGSSRSAATVELTSGEVDHARTHQPTDLFVVADIEWRLEGPRVEVSGGVAKKYVGWIPASADLTPVRFRCRVPKRGKKV